MSSKKFEFDEEDDAEAFSGHDAVWKFLNNVGSSFVVDEKVVGHSVYTYLSGLVKDVDDAVDTLVKRFNPFGYGTYVKFQASFSRYKVALVYRSTSCD